MSQPALASDQTPPRSVHRLVRINYIPRVVGYALFGVIFYTMFEGSDNLLLWAGLIWHSLLWPHAAYWHGRLSKDPVRAEFRNYAIEAFVGGTWMAISSFSLWPCCTVLVAGFANNIATGGFRLLAKNVLFAGAGAFIMAWILGFPFEPDSRLLTAYSSIVFLLVYMALVARQAYMNAKRLFRSKKALDTANEEIREKFDAAQREITERKRVEKELLRVNDDLQRFAYSVSHDLKAPLRGMAGLIHFIEEDLSEESRKRVQPNFEILGGRMLRLEKLITGILEYTQVDREEIHQPVAVKKVLEEVLLDLNIPPHITVEIASDMPTIAFSETQLTVLFSNLISNAVKYNDKPEGKIHIGYVDLGAYHEFAVQDNGEGIAPRFHARIFEMFQKLHSGDDIEGSGIGLAIVKKMVEQYGGAIRLDSEEGKGTTFFFTVPKQVNG